MPGYNATQISKPTEDVDFEKKCVFLFREILNDPNVKRVGRRGQSQQGVDVIGHRNRDAKRLVGVQCKVKEEGKELTDTEVRQEVKKALTYSPKLVEYIIVTTAKDDIKLQQLAQQLARQQAKKGRKIAIDIWGWKTLEERINEFESSREVFDPGFSPSIKKVREQLEAVVGRQSKQATKTDIVELAAKLDEVASHTKLPAVYADRELQRRLSRGLRRRGFGESDWTKESAQLAHSVMDGELSQASVSLRADVLRRAARANADGKTIEKAKRYYEAFQALTSNEVDRIYVALVADAEGDSDRALRLLRQENSKDARAVIFNILLHVKDTNQALDWIDSQGLKISDFSPVGMFNVFVKRIEVEQFDRAHKEISELSGDDFRTCPVLHLLKANLIVASVMPADQKSWAFQGLPLDPQILQPASDAGSRSKLKEARAEIGQIMALSEDLQLDAVREFLVELDLWLQLAVLDTAAEARATITKDLGDPSKILQRVRLALSYGIPVNVDVLDKHLKGRRRIGGWTNDERMAAFLLAYHGKDFSVLAAFFDEYREDLFAQEQLARGILAGIEVECLARAGRFEDARRRWAEHKAKYFPDGQAKDILEVVNSIEKGDELELLRKRYEESKQLVDLRMLVREFASKQDYRQLANYAPTFVRETKQVKDLRLALRALYHENRYGELLDLVKALADIGAQDDEVKSLRAWSLFNLGRVMEARTLARELFLQRNQPDDRELAVNTAIESGDWGYLQGILTQELVRIESLDAQTLIRLARLAFEVGSPYVDQFRDASLRRFPKNPHVFLAAYMLAVERGDEQHDSKSIEWFQKATKLSGRKGPVQSVGMRGLIARAPAWNKQVDTVETALRNGQIPIFVAAQGLKRQPVDMFLGQAIRNTAAEKPRMQAPILAYSGARPLVDLSGVGRVALDISAILTLGYLGLLRDTIDAFETIVIAPTTLSTIFQERQFIRLHQPSQKAKAERLRKLVADQRLRVLSEVSTPSKLGRNDIDGDLAELLRVAKREKAIVVRSAPVHKLGSFMDETADMTEFESVLTDTHAVLRFLSNAGKLDSTTKANAEIYLRHVDKGWPAGRAIAADSTLYLDELTVTYLDHVGLLEPLTRAVGAVFVDNSVEELSKAVLRYAVLTGETLADLARIRATLHLAIEQNKITLSARRKLGAPGGKSGKSREDILAPSLEIMTDLSKVDLIVVDDRYLNKDAYWTDGAHRAPTASTFSILNALNARGKLSQPAMWRARHKLREAGYCLVPIESDELFSSINAAPINEGAVVETPELRAIRENVSLAKRANVFLATELPWLIATRLAILQAIRAVWASGASESEAVARSNWLLYTMSDPLAWCQNPADEGQWALACNQSAAQAALLLCFFDGKLVRRKQYAVWIDSVLVRRLRANQPWLLEQALEVLKSYLARLLSEDKN